MTRRETQTLPLIGKGLTNHEISAAMCISVKTAEHYVQAVKEHFEVRNRFELIAKLAPIYVTEDPRDYL